MEYEMRIATRKEEIEFLENKLATLAPYEGHKIGDEVNFLAIHKIVLYKRCHKFAKDFEAENKQPAASWQWEMFLVDTRFGALKYVYGCNNSKSIFVRWYMRELDRVCKCTCCLYWRAISYSIPVAIIFFLLGKYLQ